MTPRPILLWPDPRLKEVAVAVGDDDEVQRLSNDLLATMYAAKGRGLAAPQIGIGRRIFVMDVHWKEGAPDPCVFVDPKLEAQSETRASGIEGCLSLPGIEASVTRPDWVHLKWTGIDGLPNSARFEGFSARCIQHEIDHLNGVVTLDHLAPEERARQEAEYSSGFDG